MSFRKIKDEFQKPPYILWKKLRLLSEFWSGFIFVIYSAGCCGSAGGAEFIPDHITVLYASEMHPVAKKRTMDNKEKSP